jgi:hypothetical protein
MVGSVVKDDEQPLTWIGGSDFSQQLHDPLGITRLPSFQADQVTVVGRISPKNVEAIPARVGLELYRMTTLDPALRGDGSMEHMCGIKEIHLPTACQRPLFAV